MYEVDLLVPVDSEKSRQEYMSTLNDESVVLSDPELENPEMNPIGEDEVSVDDVLAAISRDEGSKVGSDISPERSDMEDEGTEKPDAIGCCIGCIEMPKVIGYREFVISGHAGAILIGCADIGIPGVGVKSVYQTAFLGFDQYDPESLLELDENQIAGFFDELAKPFKAVAKAAEKVVKVAAPVVNFISKVAQGENVGHAALDSLKKVGQDFGTVSKYASSVVSLVPGVGTGVAAAIASAGALAQGKRIDEALIAGVKGAIPGGAVAQAAFEIAMKAAMGQNLGQAALEAARNNIPGGELAKKAFDVGLSLAFAKKTQAIGLSTPVTVSRPASGFGGAAAAVAAQVKAATAAQASLAASVLSSAKEMVKSPAASGMAGLSVKVPGVTPPTMATLSAANSALSKLEAARTAINAGEALAAKIRAEHRAATPAETIVLNKAGAGRVVMAAAQKNVDELQKSAAAGDKDAIAKLAILNVAKGAQAAGAGRHGQLVTDTGQIIRGFFAPA